jgi:heptosyltransferase I
MKKILLIKLTSLGDLIHALPALSDALAACPDVTFDWMVDENFYEVATWHPAVRRIYKTNHRLWRKRLFYPSTVQSLFHFVKDVKQSSYDLVIDAQGNFKTALLSLCANGPRAGFDRHSVREWIAHLSYQRRYAVSKQGHAIERLRRLFALSIGYPLPLSPPHFQIDRNQFINPHLSLPSDYLFFVHNATWKTKLWPEQYWIELIKKCIAEGLNIVLPWGNATERDRAMRLAIDPRVLVLPRLSLSEIGHVILGARACVAMDTGLSHLIAALDIPSVTLYGSTNAGLIGASGLSQIHLSSTRHCSPCEKKSCRYSAGDNPCLSEITPDRVYKELLRQASLRYL